MNKNIFGVLMVFISLSCFADEWWIGDFRAQVTRASITSDGQCPNLP